jgi:hypothetical protein
MLIIFMKHMDIDVTYDDKILSLANIFKYDFGENVDIVLSTIDAMLSYNVDYRFNCFLFKLKELCEPIRTYMLPSTATKTTLKAATLFKNNFAIQLAQLRKISTHIESGCYLMDITITNPNARPLVPNNEVLRKLTLIAQVSAADMFSDRPPWKPISLKGVMWDNSKVIHYKF